MTPLYNIGIGLYALAILLAAPFNAKARAWIKGRRKWRSSYRALMSRHSAKPVIWFHCASLGEFEMARPVMEKIKEVYGDKLFLLVSFFSPSGFDVQKKYGTADAVVYLPIDTSMNAWKFVEIVNPIMAVFVKYEIWVNYFRALEKNKAKLVLMNAVFRPDQRFFKWYGSIFRKAIKRADKIFVQNQSSFDLLNKSGIESEISGDTRYDRVMQIRSKKKTIDDIAAWVDQKFCIVCGSTWPEEETVIAQIYAKLPNDIKWIIAPHDVSESHVRKIMERFGSDAFCYSKMDADAYSKRIMIIDSVGKLGQVYSLAKVSIVGGGFSGKLHNILEPAVYGIPVLFGPNYTRFQEAVEMVAAKSAISFYDDNDIILYIEWFYYDHLMVEKVQKIQEETFQKNKGAVEKVYKYIHATMNEVESGRYVALNPIG